jgi:hypothetical protein
MCLVAGSLGILGAIAMLILASIGNGWLHEFAQNPESGMDYDSMPKEFAQFHFRLQTTVFLSFISGIIGIVFSIQLLRQAGSKWINALLLFGSGALLLAMWGGLVSRVAGGVSVIVPAFLFLASGLLAGMVKKIGEDTQQTETER